MLAYAGGVIALAAAILFCALGVITVLGGVRATRRQLVPGFVPDHPGIIERAGALLGVWGPVVLIAVLCLGATARLIQVALQAFR